MAANDRILVSTSEMLATIQKYESARQTLQEAYTKIENAKEHLDHCYKGPAYVALTVKLADIYMNVKTADRAIDESVNGLRNTISTMDTAEDTVKSNVGSTSTGTSAPVYL